MSEPSSRLLWLRDPHLAPLAASALPAWLWSIGAARILWANPPGAAVFGAETAAALATRKFDPGQPASAQIAHLAETLAPDAPPRLERLRGFGAGIGRALTCACSCIALADGTPAILVVAAERAGPDLAFDERIARLFSGHEIPLAAFAADGALIHATRAAMARLGGVTSLVALDAGAMAAQALKSGYAQGESKTGAIEIARIGGEALPVLVVEFGEPSHATTHILPIEIASIQPVVDPAPPEPKTPQDAGCAIEPELAPGEAPASVAISPPTSPVPVSEPAPPSQPAAADVLSSERRHPLRFVWQIDAGNRFTVGSEEFVALAGSQTAEALGRPWDEVAAALGLDPDGQVARAITTRDTWSGLATAWPVDDASERLIVELSGLPVFDRERAFRGYRGFGVCRDVARLNALANMRRALSAERPSAPANENVVAFRPAVDEQTPSLSPIERRAFRELSRRLTDRLNDTDAAPETGDGGGISSPAAASAADPTLSDLAEAAMACTEHISNADSGAAIDPDRDVGSGDAVVHDQTAILDRLPVGVLIYRLNDLLYANEVFLEWTGHPTLDALGEAGGLDSLFVEPGAIAVEQGGTRSFAITSSIGERIPLEGRLFMVAWQGESAFALITAPPSEGELVQARAALEQAHAEGAELKSILDTVTDGVVVVDRLGKILAANKSAEALFGRDAQELAGEAFIDLFGPDSERIAFDYLDGLVRNDAASVLSHGREVIGRERHGGRIPLFMTMGPVGDGAQKLCAVFRDITPYKRAEEELAEARRAAERAIVAKSDLIVKISHEIRTPLNAIIGFSEVMMQERFGPVGTERYRQYLTDIHSSGSSLVALVNDLLDLSKIEAGKLELTFTDIGLNELTQQCVASKQADANRERIIIRTSLSPKLPQIVADPRSVRQIVLNLLSNSIKYTGAGGQVIVSTAVADMGDVVLRVRDTGIGMSEKDMAAALEPFRHLTTSTRWGSGGTGLGLPLTKALAEANRARFGIKSAPNAGTLVEVTFPATRVLAE